MYTQLSPEPTSRAKSRLYSCMYTHLCRNASFPEAARFPRSGAQQDQEERFHFNGERNETMTVTTLDGPVSRKIGGGEAKLIFASSLGTVFEWYDFYLYGSLATIISKQFFPGVNETAGFIFALLAFAAGFAVRPFGALIFGRLGDMVGRKYTFLVTIVIMGLSTALVGVLPGYGQIGVAAPVILVVLRMLQGLALGGEYGGAATYVGEHAPPDKRGLYTSWIQTTATLGLFLSLVVILVCRSVL